MISARIPNIADYSKEGELLKNPALTRKSAIINYWLNQKQNDFKNRLRSYNNSIQEMLLPTILRKTNRGRNFLSVFEKQISDELKNSLNLVFPKENLPEISQTQTEKEVISIPAEKAPVNSDKAAIEKELLTLRTAYKYTNDAQTAEQISTLEITLKYL